MIMGTVAPISTLPESFKGKKQEPLLGQTFQELFDSAVMQSLPCYFVALVVYNDNSAKVFDACVFNNEDTGPTPVGRISKVHYFAIDCFTIVKGGLQANTFDKDKFYAMPSFADDKYIETSFGGKQRFRTVALEACNPYLEKGQNRAPLLLLTAAIIFNASKQAQPKLEFPENYYLRWIYALRKGHPEYVSNFVKSTFEALSPAQQTVLLKQRRSSVQKASVSLT